MNPGSREARDNGCACSYYDNRKGEGIPSPDGSRHFWINNNCPMHGEPEVSSEIQNPA